MNIYRSIFTTLIAFGAIAVSQPNQPSTRTHMTNNTQRALTHIEAFEKNRDPDDLREAANILSIDELTPGPTAQENVGNRNKMLDAWLRLLNVLDANLDPTFNPDDKPALNLHPPGEAGMAYGSGTKPEDISDPVLRKQYEDSIERNRQKSVAYSLQVQLQRVNETATPKSERFIRKFYSTSPTDREELRREVSKTIKNEKRAGALLEAIKSRR